MKVVESAQTKPYAYTRDDIEEAQREPLPDPFFIWLLQQPKRCAECGRSCRCAR